MAIEKPTSIENDAFKSAKWDELVFGRDFKQSDVPSLTLLCQWYAVVERCMDDMDVGDTLPQIAYSNEAGDIKALPQLSTMKQASAEIRALNKQLGIDDRCEEEHDKAKPANIISIVSARRAQRLANSSA